MEWLGGLKNTSFLLSEWTALVTGVWAGAKHSHCIVHQERKWLKRCRLSVRGKKFYGNIFAPFWAREKPIHLAGLGFQH